MQVSGTLHIAGGVHSWATSEVVTRISAAAVARSVTDGTLVRSLGPSGG